MAWNGDECLCRYSVLQFDHSLKCSRLVSCRMAFPTVCVVLGSCVKKRWRKQTRRNKRHSWEMGRRAPGEFPFTVCLLTLIPSPPPPPVQIRTLRIHFLSSRGERKGGIPQQLSKQQPRLSSVQLSLACPPCSPGVMGTSPLLLQPSSSSFTTSFSS